MFRSCFRWAVSFFWSTGTFLLRRLYRWFGIGRRFPNTFVLSVGNLQAGGSGKTPMIRYLARYLMHQGFSVAIVSRDYKRSAKSTDVKSIRVFPPNANLDRVELGDEARLQWECLSGSFWLGLGKNRAAVIEELFRQGFPNDRSVVLLDDAFQHFSVIADFRLVLLTNCSRFQAYFRDFSFEKQFADFLVCMRDFGDSSVASEDQSDFRRAEVFRKICFNTEISPNERVSVVCGIGDPVQFITALGLMGCFVQKKWIYPDHHEYSKDELDRICRDSRELGFRVVTTGKDWVKIRKHLESTENWVIAEPEIHWIAGEKALMTMLHEKMKVHRV